MIRPGVIQQRHGGICSFLLSLIFGSNGRTHGHHRCTDEIKTSKLYYGESRGILESTNEPPASYSPPLTDFRRTRDESRPAIYCPRSFRNAVGLL